MTLLVSEVLAGLPAAVLPRLVKMFGDTTPGMLRDIRQAANAGDWSGMGSAAHRLKGSCVSLGAQRMAEICQTLQHQGEAGEGQGVPGLLDELEDLYQPTFQALQNLVR